MTKISTKNTPANTGGGFFAQKMLQPGVNKCVIHGIKLEKAQYITQREEYFLTLSLEGEPQKVGFDGFLKDPANKTGPKYAGQQAFVKSSNFGYFDGTTNNGYPCTVQDSVLGFLYELCTELGILPWLHSIDNKYDTIQEIVQAFDKEKPFEGIWINYLLAAKVYQNKAGYDAYDLHLVRSTKEGKAFCGDFAQIMKFDKDKHLFKPKPKDPKPAAETKSETPHTDAINADFQTQKQAMGNPFPENNVVETTTDIVVDDGSDLPFDVN